MAKVWKEVLAEATKLIDPRSSYEPQEAMRLVKETATPNLMKP